MRIYPVCGSPARGTSGGVWTVVGRLPRGYPARGNSGSVACVAGNVVGNRRGNTVWCVVIALPCLLEVIMLLNILVLPQCMNGTRW